MELVRNSTDMKAPGVKRRKYKIDWAQVERERAEERERRDEEEEKRLDENLKKELETALKGMDAEKPKPARNPLIISELKDVIAKALEASKEGGLYRKRQNWKGKASYIKQIDALWNKYTGGADVFYNEIPFDFGWTPKAKQVEAPRKAPAPKPAKEKEENTKYTVSRDINDLITDYLRKYLMDNDFSEDEADEKLDEEFLDVLEDLGGGYGDYDDLLADILKVMKKHYKPREIALGMSQLREDGYTFFDDYIEKHL